MAAPDSLDVPANTPVARVVDRTKLRVGFALCAAALGLVLALGLVSLCLVSLSPEWVKSHERAWQVAIGVTVNPPLIAGLVCLYLAARGDRWRRASALLLAMTGVDLAILGLLLANAQPEVMNLGNLIGDALAWVELWMIAVLAAEAAEGLERPDISHQTEVVGRLIIAGGFVWLANLIWSSPLPAPSPAAKTDAWSFSMILEMASKLVQLFALARTMIFCGALVMASPPTASEHEPVT